MGRGFTEETLAVFDILTKPQLTEEEKHRVMKVAEELRRQLTKATI